MVISSGLYGTLKRVVWNFEEGSVTLVSFHYYLFYNTTVLL